MRVMLVWNARRREGYLFFLIVQMLATAVLNLVGGDPTVMEPLRSDPASVELLMRFQVRAWR